MSATRLDAIDMKHLNSPRIAAPQQGFAAIAAIFLVVVLAGMGAFMLTFSNTNQLNSAKDVQGSRAYWAARTGLEWGVAKALANPAACPASPSLFTVEGFALTVDCTRQTYSEGTATVTVFNFISTATGGGVVGSVGYVERSVSGAIEL
jgi:MSHA biogenesis protein MshP